MNPNPSPLTLQRITVRTNVKAGASTTTSVCTRTFYTNGC